MRRILTATKATIASAINATGTATAAAGKPEEDFKPEPGALPSLADVVGDCETVVVVDDFVVLDVDTLVLDVEILTQIAPMLV